MSFTKSLYLYVAAVDSDDANRLMAALGLDTLPGDTFSVEIATTVRGAPTHYGADTWDDDLADILDNGTLPRGIVWADFGLTARPASDALAAIKYRSVVNRTPSAKLRSRLTDDGLKRVEHPDIVLATPAHADDQSGGALCLATG